MSRGRSAPTLRPAFVMSTRAFDVCEGRSASSALTRLRESDRSAFCCAVVASPRAVALDVACGAVELVHVLLVLYVPDDRLRQPRRRRAARAC